MRKSIGLCLPPPSIGLANGLAGGNLAPLHGGGVVVVVVVAWSHTHATWYLYEGINRHDTTLKHSVE